MSIEDMKTFIKSRFDNIQTQRKFDFLCKDLSIQNKHSVLPDFNNLNQTLYESKNPSTENRLKIYENEALKISIKSSEKAIEKSKIDKDKINHIIYVSCTGMAAPGMEINLINKLNLNPRTQKYAINFMGCYAAIHGLRLAHLICNSDKNATVLLVCTELCTLHFQDVETDEQLLSTYLFGDGSAACIISNHSDECNSLNIVDFSSSISFEGYEDMSWTIGQNGFDMILTKNVPKFIEKNIKSTFDELLLKNNVSKSELHFAIHPGGKKILEAFEKALDIYKNQLQNSYDILQENGNMSSVTLMFVLEKIYSKKLTGSVFASAFGPGLSIENLLLKYEN